MSEADDYLKRLRKALNELETIERRCRFHKRYQDPTRVAELLNELDGSAAGVREAMTNDPETYGEI